MSFRNTATIFFALILMGCTTSPPKSQSEPASEFEGDLQAVEQHSETSGASRGGVQVCDEPRPEVCASIYAPVCAMRDDGARVTRSNGCRACADQQVATFLTGACPKP